MVKLDAELLEMMRFVQNAAPELIVEKMNFLGDAHTNTHTRFRNRKGASRKIRRVTDLFRNLQNALTGGFLDAAAPVQCAIHRTDGNVRHFRDAVDSVLLLAHLTHSAIPRAASYACFCVGPALPRKIKIGFPPNGRLVSAVPGPPPKPPPLESDLGYGTRGPRTLTRFNETEEKNNRLGRFAA